MLGVQSAEGNPHHRYGHLALPSGGLTFADLLVFQSGDSFLEAGPLCPLELAACAEHMAMHSRSPFPGSFPYMLPSGCNWQKCPLDITSPRGRLRLTLCHKAKHWGGPSPRLPLQATSLSNALHQSWRRPGTQVHSTGERKERHPGLSVLICTMGRIRLSFSLQSCWRVMR